MRCDETRHDVPVRRLKSSSTSAAGHCEIDDEAADSEGEQEQHELSAFAREGHVPAHLLEPPGLLGIAAHDERDHHREGDETKDDPTSLEHLRPPQRSSKRGARFSRKAATPSAKSRLKPACL